LRRSLPGFAESALVSFARDSDNAADRRSFVCLHLKLLCFFLHSDPPQFADKMKGLNRWTLKVRDGDFSPFQINAHGISLLQALRTNAFIQRMTDGDLNPRPFRDTLEFICGIFSGRIGVP
jgi:hypothetical protein